MLYSKIYKRHFPVLSKYTEFTEEEKKTLRKWVNTFEIDCEARRESYRHSGILYYQDFNLDLFEPKKINEMIDKNQFDDLNLAILNIIIYRHKYNAFLSIWCFPLLTNDVARRYIKDSIA